MISWFFYSLCIIFSCFFVCLIIFDWMPDVLNFSLLGAGFSFSLKNTRELCARLLGNSWIFLRASFYKLCKVGLEEPYCRADFAPLWRWYAVEYSAQASTGYRLCLLLGRNGSCPRPVWAPGVAPPAPLPVVHSLASASFFTCKSWLVCRSPECLLCALPSGLAAWAFKSSHLHLPNSGRPGGLAWVSLSCTGAWKRFPSSELGQQQSSLLIVSPFSEATALHCLLSIAWKTFFHMFFWLSISLRVCDGGLYIQPSLFHLGRKQAIGLFDFLLFSHSWGASFNVPFVP